jgi:alpha-glucosidase
MPQYASAAAPGHHRSVRRTPANVFIARAPRIGAKFAIDRSERSTMRPQMPSPVLPLSLSLLLAALPVQADTVASVRSPDGSIAVELDLNGEGRLAYRVQRKGEPLVDDSRLGFILRNGRQLLRGLALDGQSSRSVDTTWELPWGERRFVREHYNELRAGFVERDHDRRRFDVVVRVFDDGIGFRYEVPKQPALDEVQIQEELTEFAIAKPATAWWLPAFEWNREEYLYNRTPLSEVGVAQTPLTLRTDDGTHVAIHEAALIDYAGMNLAKGDGGRLRAMLTPGSPAKVVRRTPFATPWRTLQIADRAGGLVESNLILNLNAPNALGDVSWFKPSKYVGVWWSLHLDTQTWGTGPKHGATTANTKRYIDFAAKHGFRGVLVEGWNIGWDGDWFANGWQFDFSKPTPDYDLEGLAAYAKAKGVHLIGHHETACAVSHYERQMDAAFATFARLGIDVVKTGYVCDAGQIERQDIAGGPVLREWHEGQFMSGHHLRVVQAAAKHRIAINAHEPIKDTGLRRTYPNWVSREGARGQEFNAWGHPPNPPEHEPNLVYTRMLAGPMDFTPGVLSLTGRNGQEIQNTLARQLADYVVLYSPVHMAADLPEHYAKYPDAFRFIRDVPVDWQDTRAPAGEVGDFAVIARKDRNSEDWYLGAVNDEDARTVSVPLSFLDAGRRYRAEIHRDGDGAGFRGTRRFSFVRETREVRASDTLDLRLAPGGGQAIRFVAL